MTYHITGRALGIEFGVKILKGKGSASVNYKMATYNNSVMKGSDTPNTVIATVANCLPLQSSKCGPYL